MRIVAVGVLLVLAVVVAALVARYVVVTRDARRILDALAARPDGRTFDREMIADLPEPAQRYLLHAIKPGTPLASTVRLKSTGRMKPNPDADYLDLAAHETLAARRGFVWRARAKAGPASIHVTDHYVAGESSVRIAAFGLIPLGTDSGPDVARSSRHRLAAEHIWLPSSLLPGEGVSWLAVADDAARASLTIDGESINITLQLDERGAVRTLSMERYGNVGRDGYGPIPYGFEVGAEGSYGGYTIPTQLTGGWWFGSETYEPGNASSFTVSLATFE